MSPLFSGKLNILRKLSERNGQSVIKVQIDEETQVITNFKFGHRASAKCIDEQNMQKWYPRVQVNKQLVYFEDQDVPDGIKFFTSRYLALNFARRFLAQKHRKTLLSS